MFPLSLMFFSIFFLKFLAKAGTLSIKFGLISLIFTGIFLSDSIGVLPILTNAILAPLYIKQ